MTVVGERPAASTPESAPRGALIARLVERFPRLRTMLVLGALVAVLNMVHVSNYSVISPFDEYAHIDSMIRGSRGQILVHPDDQLTQATLDEVACRESEHAEFPKCSPERYDPAEFTYRGWNQASSHSPYYYVITGLTARVLWAPPPTDSIVTWARMLGTAWLLLGFYLVLRGADLLELPRVPVALALLLFAVVPPVIHATNTVNPDATGIVSGAVALLAALAWERRGVGLWIVALGAFICASLDTTNMIGIGIVALYLGLRALGVRLGRAAQDARPVRDYLTAAATSVGSGVVALFGWVIAYNLLAHQVDLDNAPWVKGVRVDSFEIEMVIGAPTLFGILPPVQGFMAPILKKAPVVGFTVAALLLVTGALLGTAFRAELHDRVSTLALAAVGALILVPPLFVLYEYLAAQLFFELNTRQALSAVPAMALVIAALARTRPTLVVLGFVAGGLYLSTLMTLLF